MYLPGFFSHWSEEQRESQELQELLLEGERRKTKCMYVGAVNQFDIFLSRPK